MFLIKKYLPALFTVIIWGSTFVASKHVIGSGLSPVIVMAIRFTLAYFILLMCTRERMRLEWNTTELKMLIVALTGGSLYFFLEYTSLKYTNAVNVGLISATVPIVSTIIDSKLKHRFPSRLFVIGSIIAFIGVLILVTNGNLLIDIFPKGDVLAICSTIMWAVYSVVLSRIDKTIPEAVVERRMMFYSLLTALPFAILFFDGDKMRDAFSQTDIVLSILYLGCIASAFCMWLWNVSINTIGVTKTNNFLYLLPVVSLLSSVVFIDAEITFATVVSTVLIFIGIVLADR